MSKRKLDVRMLGTLFVILTSVCLSAFAGLRSGTWSLNPSDYRYDMSLYFRLHAEECENLDMYEIGAFVGDECRGIAEKLDLPEGESCLYMRIRSNSAASEEIVFKLRDKETGTTVTLEGKDAQPFMFKADEMVGLPSDPFVLYRYFNVSLTVGEHGSVDFENGLYAEGSVIELTAVPNEGYHLESWNNGSTDEKISLTVTEDTELSVTFAPNIYKAAFVIEEDTVATLEVPFGEPIVAPEVPVREGYTFSGWTDLPETMPAKDIVITGSYTVNVYKAVFVIDGETVATLEVPFGEAIVAPKAPVREGYTFNGWTDVPETMPAKDIEITGSYTVNVYKAVFVIDGETVATLKFPFGETIIAPEAPEREGYTFSGWTDLPETMPAKDIEITGSYTVNVYKVSFVLDGETVATLEVPFGGAIVAPEAPEREGYTFNGWTDLPETMPAKDIEITGSYTVNVYKAVFIIDGETVATLEVPFGEAIVAPEAPAREGYTFSGWTDLPETMPAKDIEITGSYAVNVYKVSFVIDGETVATLEVPFGETIVAPEAPEREGYTFNGWTDLPETMPAKDIEITGSYTVNVYKAIFVIDGETVATLEVPFGETIVAPEAPEREGYTFNGWTDLPETMPAKDIEIIGSYTVNKYRLTVYLNDEIYMDTELDYGQDIVIPDPQVPDNMMFDGWKEEIPATMPAHDLVIHGTTSAMSAISAIAADCGGELVIYTLNGVLVYKGNNAAEAKARLEAGLYIVNGRKVVVK